MSTNPMPAGAAALRGGLLQAFLESTDDGLLVVTTGGRVSYCNSRFVEMWGIPAELVERGDEAALIAHIAPQLADPGRFAPLVHAARASAGRHRDVLDLRDGRILERSSSPLEWPGGERALIWHFHDVTEAHRADAALRASRELLSESQRIAHIGSWELDLETLVLTWTEENFRIYGRDPATFQPNLDRLFGELALPEDVPHMQAHMAETMATGVFQPFEYRIRRPDGEVRCVHITGEIVRDAAGKPIRQVGTQQDITERKQAEQERLDLERRLLHAQKLESLGVLAGGIAHDFNNLLTAILGNLDLALLSLPPHSPSRAEIRKSMTAARRASDLTRQMLSYAGRVQFDLRALDASALVEENAGLFRTCISKLATLDLRLERDLPPILADPGQVQQVVMNLITNASEAIGEREGVITLSTCVRDCDRAVLGRSRAGATPAPGRFVQIEVADTGCGMDEETQQRLFDPFFTTKFMGRGLGMSAILGIVRAHGGAVLVDSRVGAGTTISVLFPAGDARLGAAEPGEGARPAVAAVRPQGTILVVDDEVEVRRVCARMLQLLGWQVLEAEDGVAAVELYRRHAADIVGVVLDLSMPRRDGVTVFRELRALAPRLRVILSSGYGSSQEKVERLRAEGIAGFIQKPYTTEVLERELARSGVGVA